MSNLQLEYCSFINVIFFRASIEPNFHDLYLKFLDKVNSKALNKEILKATYENCKVALCFHLIYIIVYQLINTDDTIKHECGMPNANFSSPQIFAYRFC